MVYWSKSKNLEGTKLADLCSDLAHTAQCRYKLVTFSSCKAKLERFHHQGVEPEFFFPDMRNDSQTCFLPGTSIGTQVLTGSHVKRP